MIKYKKMSLFDAPENSILVHACNSQGVWGRGIAQGFKDRYPASFNQYKKYCEYLGGASKSGYGYICKQENKHEVVCLITSHGYAKDLASPDEIIYNTVTSLEDFYSQHQGVYTRGWPIYSNKFNSGLFNVPWEKTAAMLEVFVTKYNLDWTVCEI